jgi:PAS domain S-box-containing protein
MNGKPQNGTQYVSPSPAEHALRASELSYRRLFEAAGDGILILDFATGRVTDANPFLTELLGFSHDEMVGKTVGELSPFKDLVSNQAMLERLQQDGYVRYEDLPLETKDGRKISVEFVSNVYQAGDEQVIQCNIRDITERNQTKQRLSLLNTCISHLNEIIIIAETDPTGQSGPKTVFVNDAFERISGFSSAGELGGTPNFLRGRNEDPRVLAEIHHALVQQQPIRRQVVFFRKDGTEYWMDIDVVPIFNATGACTHLAAIERDITAARKNEEQLLWKTALLEAQLESSIDGILVVDNQGKKILQNRRLNELWKIPPAVGDPAEDAVQVVFASSQARHPRSFIEKVAHLYNHPEEASHDEIELLDGTTLDRYSAPVRDQTGKYYGRIWSFRDITERQKLENQFHQAQKMESIGQLAGGIAHDFNNILTAITGSLFLLNLDAAEQPALLEHIGNISVAARRAADLVNQILTFSRQNKAAREPVKLNPLVLEALRLLRSSLPSTIRIETALSETPVVLANPTAIHQVMMNLGTNAWHAMRNQPGVLKVELALMEADADFIQIHPDLRPGPCVRLSVSDTGCGMERDTMERAFDPFFTTKAVGEGTGLGLAVVHGIMKSHDGAIALYSRPGEGATFHLYFPVLAAAAADHAVESSPIPRGRGEQILFVDDEEVLAALGKTMLERLGYAVTMTTQPLEALTAVRKQPGRFDLIITDLTMPGMDGITLGQQLLQIQPRLAIILSTGYAGILTTGKVRELGFQELLDKPAQARSLGEAVYRALHQKAFPRL